MGIDLNNKQLKYELDDLKENQANLTTSDLQGVVYVLSCKYGEDENELLEYIYEGVL